MNHWPCSRSRTTATIPLVADEFRVSFFFFTFNFNPFPSITSLRIFSVHNNTRDVNEIVLHAIGRTKRTLIYNNKTNAGKVISYFYSRQNTHSPIVQNVLIIIITIIVCNILRRPSFEPFAARFGGT